MFVLPCIFDLPEETAGIGRNEVHAILMCPVIDFQLLLERYTAKYHNLSRVRSVREPIDNL